MMLEIILFNEIKTPVGANSERLMSESLSRSFKRFVQTADSSDVYAWDNGPVPNGTLNFHGLPPT